MWDTLILTAMNDQQREIFKQQLEIIDWKRYARSVEVAVDPSGPRVGSGGATIQLLTHRKFNLHGHTLLIHSGGLSQRTPHVSTIGKVFSTLSSGQSILECKLQSYRSLPFILPPGIFIGASDVIESLPIDLPEIKESIDIVLLTHRSIIPVAEQHGVYVVNDEGILERVLQKPTEEEMREAGAILDDKTVLTDSAFFLSVRTCTRLISANIPLDRELCAYGDFLRPLGTKPDQSYIEATSDPVLYDERQLLFDAFYGSSVQMINCGADSFFHFGTIAECLDHSESGSIFANTVLAGKLCSNIINCQGKFAIEGTATAEYCKIAGQSTVGNRSIVSGISTGEEQIDIPSEVLVYSTPVNRNGRTEYVTVVIGIHDNIKKHMDNVVWGGVQINAISGSSLWDAPLFESADSMEESARSSLHRFERRSIDYKIGEWSMAEVVRYANTKGIIDWRRGMMK